MRFSARVSVSKRDLELFRKVVKRFKPQVRKLPELGDWESYQNHSPWLDLVGEIITIGKSEPLDSL